jgi:dienelactone hydrolase
MSSVLLVSHTMKRSGIAHRQYKLLCDPGEGREKASFVIDLLYPQGPGPFPVVLRGDGCWGMPSDEVVRSVLSRGYILANFNRTELAPDNANRSIGLFSSYPNGDFGGIAAWAWGFHRCVDFLLTEPQVDRARIVITGHSRGGKAALLAGALDSRIALTVANGSGCGGAGCFRFEGEKAERLENILQSFPYWFTPRLK